MSSDLPELAASLLGDLTRELVFVGGASIHLWLSDPAAPPVRGTDDVDAICDVLGPPAYHASASAYVSTASARRPATR